MFAMECPQCKSELDEPRRLPCGNSVCSYCVNTTENPNEFNCILCQSCHQVF